jgi:hypothetical protein
VASGRQLDFRFEDVCGSLQHRPVQRSYRLFMGEQGRHLAAQVMIVAGGVVHKRLALRRFAFEGRLIDVRDMFPAFGVHSRRFSTTTTRAATT